MLAVFEEGKVRTRDIGGDAKTAEFARSDCGEDGKAEARGLEAEVRG